MKKNIIALSLLVMCLSTGSLLQAMGKDSHSVWLEKTRDLHMKGSCELLKEDLWPELTWDLNIEWRERDSFSWDSSERKAVYIRSNVTGLDQM